MTTPILSDLLATRATETQSAAKTAAEIEAMTLEQAIETALVWTKWNDAAQAYRVIAIWGKAHDRNPRFIATIEVERAAGYGTRKMLVRAHNTRRDPDVLAVLGADWTDTWTM